MLVLQKDFGRLPERFSGVVIENMSNECFLKVRAKLKKHGK